MAQIGSQTPIPFVARLEPQITADNSRTLRSNQEREEVCCSSRLSSNFFQQHSATIFTTICWWFHSCTYSGSCSTILYFANLRWRLDVKRLPYKGCLTHSWNQDVCTDRHDLRADLSIFFCQRPDTQKINGQPAERDSLVDIGDNQRLSKVELCWEEFINKGC